MYITATNNMLRAHMAGGGGRVACPLSTPLLAQLRMLFNVSDKQMALACATSVMQRLTNGEQIGHAMAEGNGKEIVVQVAS